VVLRRVARFEGLDVTRPAARGQVRVAHRHRDPTTRKLRVQATDLERGS
jgi:hypothetical protein